MSLVDFLWAIPVFGLLIFIHELGHFAVAKYFGIRVHEFALGFGPVVGGFERGETRYNLRAIPLGGFVRMAGMEEGDQDDPDGFNSKPVYARALVIAAGPVMNFVLASLLYSAFLFFIGSDVLQTPVLGGVLQNCSTSVAAETVSLPCPAYTAGLQEGDRILTIDGNPVENWQDILQLVSQSGGEPLSFELVRDGETRLIEVEPIQSDGRWLVGIMPATKREPLGSALIQGPVWTVRVLGLMVNGLKDMLLGEVEAEISGPVGITVAIAESASQGWSHLITLTALLSVNLGLLNLLPIPALDGSRLVFMAVEVVRGRRLNPQRENMVHFVGFLLLIGLMLVVAYSDLARL